MDQKIADMAAFMKIAGTAGTNTSAEAGAGAACVVVTTEDERREWSHMLLEHFGQTVFPMEAYFNQAPGGEKVDLVLIDAQSLTQQQISRLLPFVMAQGARPLLVLENGAHPPVGTEHLQRLGIVFSRWEIAAALDHQPI